MFSPTPISGAPNIGNAFTNIVQDGKLLPAAVEAKKRGVVFDVGHGGGSFDYTIAEAAIAGGAGPDVISSDIHVFSGNSPGMPYLTWVMSKFMNLGYTLEQVVTMATATPAKVINKMPKAGTLQVGAPGDVSLLEVVEGPVELCRHAQQQARRQDPYQTGGRRDRRRCVRAAVPVAVCGAVISQSRPA